VSQNLRAKPETQGFNCPAIVHNRAALFFHENSGTDNG